MMLHNLDALIAAKQQAGLAAGMAGSPHYGDVAGSSIDSAGDFDRLHCALTEMVSHVEHMTAQVNALADQLFGCPPPSSAPPNKGVPEASNGSVSAVHGMAEALRGVPEAEALRDRLGQLYEGIARFRRLA
jgi:hypothetical protein